MRLARRPRPSSGLLALAGLVALVLAISACGSDDVNGTAATTTAGSGAGTLEGSWTLESATVDGDEVTAQSPAATITFADAGTFQGRTPCNGMSGTWTDDDGALSLELGPMTQMACAEPAVHAQETAITRGFPSVTSAEADGDALVLTGDGVTFRWVPGPESLVGSYQVTGVNNGAGGVVSDAVTETMTVEFATDGYLRGFDGCNAWGTPYRVDGLSLTFGPEWGGETKACPSGDAQRTMQQFHDAVLSTASWERDGTTVTLRDASGATQLVLVPVG